MKEFNVQRPRLLQLPYHLLSKVIEPLLAAGSFFLPGPKAVELRTQLHAAEF
jgi:hypothetical protein